jgi:alpha-N-arabinofuranosidase
MPLMGQIRVEEAIPQTATIRVDAGVPVGKAIPRTIFGTFLEPIRESTYGGLWAQILKNPSLETGLWDAPHVAQMLAAEPSLARASQLDLPLPWEPLDASEGNRYAILYGNAANSWQSLEVMGVPGHATGIEQRVYLPVQRELTYRGSLYARHVSGPDGITVSIRRRDGGAVLAEANVTASSATWTKYRFTLTVPRGKLHRLEPADFVVAVEGSERVDVDELSLMPADALDGLDPDVVRMAKAMDTPLVRFGGNFTSWYNWRDGIGPRDKRVSMRNEEWGIPEYNTFGTDEFLHFCALIGAEPQIAVNMGRGTPDEAADWVRYVDAHWHQHGGLLWEMGNELWGSWNMGYPTLGELPGRTLRFSRAIRKVDPTAKLIATGADPDHFEKWNAAQLTNPAGTFDYLSTHFVVTTTATDTPHASTDFINEAAFALPVELGRKLEEQQAQIDSVPAFAKKAHIAFTEWLFIGHRPGTPNFTNMGGALDTAGFLNMLMRHAAVVPVADMTGIMDFAGIWKDRGQVFAAPGYYAFKMYARAGGVHPVKVTTDAGSYSVEHGVSRLPEIKDVPYLDVVAATTANGDELDLFCVNRSLNTDIPAEIRLAHFAAGGAARIETLQASYVGEGNDADDPMRVVPQRTSAAVAGGMVRHVFPHESVTVIRIRRKE